MRAHRPDGFRETKKTRVMNQYPIDPQVKTKNYREVTVFSADEFFREIYRAQRGWKEFAYALPIGPKSSKVVKDGKWAATITLAD